MIGSVSTAPLKFQPKIKVTRLRGSLLPIGWSKYVPNTIVVIESNDVISISEVNESTNFTFLVNGVIWSNEPTFLM